MAQTLKVMQESILAQLSEILKNQKLLKDSINQISLTQSSQSKGIDNLQATQRKIQEQVESISISVLKLDKPRESSDPLPPEPVPVPPTVPLASFSTPPPRQSCEQTISQPNPSSMISVALPNSSSEPPNMNIPPSKRIPTSKRPKVLFIADSIGRNIDLRHLEEATNTLIYKEKAFGASYKPDALRPYENFNSVSMTALKKKNYSYVILQGAATDITNLETSFSPSSNLHYFKQEAFLASQNMITAARNILLANSNVKKVLILERIPRFDPQSADPNQIKQELSDYANNVLKEELDKCDLKSRISLGIHSLPKELQPNLYGHPTAPYFDGVHLRGPDGRNHYTRSVCNILQNFFVTHSREPHNHVIPRIPPHVQNHQKTTNSPFFSTLKTIPSSSNNLKKPDHVIIDIDSEPENMEINCTETHYCYTIPTYNPFSLLEN